MKTTLLIAALLCAGVAAHAQATAVQISAIKTALTSKTWKTESTRINGLSPVEFENLNNIHKVDIYPAGDRYKFSPDGTFTVISTAGGAKAGIWDIDANGRLVLNPGQNGGTSFGLTFKDINSFSGKTIHRLGLCNVTSLYEVAWVPAQMQ